MRSVQVSLRPVGDLAGERDPAGWWVDRRGQGLDADPQRRAGCVAAAAAGTAGAGSTSAAPVAASGREQAASGTARGGTGHPARLTAGAAAPGRWHRVALPCPTSPSAPAPRGAVPRRAELLRISPVVDELGARFTAAGEQIALVGGPVRDAMLGRLHNDLDLTTSARPEITEKLLAGWADAVWDMGRAFGTIGCRKGDWQVEITTYRSDAYDADSRKPAVAYGDSLEGDLVRRDFTVNAMAVTLPDREFVDPYGGMRGPRARGAADPGHAGGLVLRRPAADDARRPVLRPARLRRRPGGGRGDDRHGRPHRDRLGRAGPRRAGQAGDVRRTRAAAWRCWWRPGWPSGCCPSCRRWRWSATSTTGTRTSTSTR